MTGYRHVFGDCALDAHIIRNNFYPSSNILHFCIHRNLASTAKVLFHIHREQYGVNISSLYPGDTAFVCHILHGIKRGSFKALASYIDYFIDNMDRMQIKILDKVFNVVNKLYDKDNYASAINKLQIFYDIFIRCMHKHNKSIEWKEVSFYYLACNMVNSDKSNILNKLIVEDMVDDLILLEYDERLTTRVQSNISISHINIEIMKVLLRHDAPVSKHMLISVVQTCPDCEELVDVLMKVEEKHGTSQDSSPLSYWGYWCPLSIVLKHNNIAMFKFLLDKYPNMILRNIDSVLQSKNMNALRHIDNSFPKQSFEQVCIMLKEVYPLGSLGSECIDTTVELLTFLRAHKVQVTADADEWLRLSIDINDQNMAYEILQHKISPCRLQECANIAKNSEESKPIYMMILNSLEM